MTFAGTRSILCVFLLVLFGCSGSPPPLKVYSREGIYYIDVRDGDAKVSTVLRLQVRDGQHVVWELRAVGERAQIGWFEVRKGHNRKTVERAYFGSYQTLVPERGDTFDLQPQTTYEAAVWGTGSIPATATLRIE